MARLTLREELEELNRLVRVLVAELREASRIDAITAAIDRRIVRWINR